MNRAVISGDIIASTSLSAKGRDHIEKGLTGLFTGLKGKLMDLGRLIKGDYIECVISKNEDALLVALIIKSYIKSVADNDEYLDLQNKRIKLFKTYGIRLAIGYGELSRFDAEKNLIDGEAIYFSGRKINEESTFNKERITIKNTLFFVSGNQELNNETESILALIDVLLSKATARQCEILYLKLGGHSEDTIAGMLNIAQSAVNQHSTSLGWNALEKALAHFRHIIKKYEQ